MEASTSNKRKAREYNLSKEDDEGGYDSTFEDDIEEKDRKKKRHDLARKQQPPREAMPSKAFFNEEVTRDEGRRQRFHLVSLNAYDRHKQLINDYLLYYPGATSVLKRDTSKDKRDIDIIRDNHKFLWDDDEDANTWEKELSKRYYDKLFKEFCICDLSRYKENKIAMRWRIEQEVINGKGQFTCGEKKCTDTDNLRTWEVNFSYIEQEEKKNALVKLRLCPECSLKLNYRHKRKEIVKKRSTKNVSPSNNDSSKSDTCRTRAESSKESSEIIEANADNIWKEPIKLDDKSSDEKLNEFLEDLFF